MKITTMLVAVASFLAVGTSAVLAADKDCQWCERPTNDGRTTGNKVLKKAYVVKVCNPSWDRLSEGAIKGAGRVGRWWKAHYLSGFKSDDELTRFLEKYREATNKQERLNLLKSYRPWKRPEAIETECKTLSVAPGTVLLTEICDEDNACLGITKRITQAGTFSFTPLVCQKSMATK